MSRWWHIYSFVGQTLPSLVLAIKTIEHSTIERLLTDNKPSPWISKYIISCIRYKNNNNKNTGIIGILNVGIKLTIYFKIFSYILSQSL